MLHKVCQIVKNIFTTNGVTVILKINRRKKWNINQSVGFIHNGNMGFIGTLTGFQNGHPNNGIIQT